MKIKEVEERVGITRKNIRFYEEQGLFSPKRNSENGYREYSEEDLTVLLRIKAFRKLGIPIEEIRQMFQGNHTVADAMKRHLISLEREQRNLEQSSILCEELSRQDILIQELDTDAILNRMEDMERFGMAFRNKQTEDIRIRYVAPVMVTFLMVAFMITMSFVVLWSYYYSPQEAPPIGFILLTIGVFLAVAVGVILALTQRIREIGKGEIDDAKYY